MIGFGEISGRSRGVTGSQFWFVVIFSSVAACLFLGVLRYAEKEISQQPTEQEKEEFWQRLSERDAENEVILVKE